MRHGEHDRLLLADDAAVIERSWHEPEQFAALFDRHAPRIHRYAARRAGTEVADDLVAETFLAAFARRRRVDASKAHGGTDGWQPCVPSPAYLPGRPAMPAAVGGYLERTRHVVLGGTVADVDQLGDVIDNVLMSTYLAPAQLAAMYEFMAGTPGFSVVPGAANAVGRHGVGISWQVSDGDAVAPGDTSMIIFDSRTGAYLGDNTRHAGERPGEYDGGAVVRLAIVNAIGQLP